MTESILAMQQEALKKEEQKPVVKLNPERKAQWLAALRSETYKQGQHTLLQKDNNGNCHFCCLGVATELYRNSPENTGKFDWQRVNGTNTHQFDDEDSVLPHLVIDWLGADKAHLDKLEVPEELRIKYNIQKKLYSVAELNDHGLTFHEIADLIEAQL